MRFQFPYILSLIPVAIIMLGLFFYWASRRRLRLLARFGDMELIQKLSRGVSQARQHWKAALLTAAAALLLFSLSRPQYGAIERPLERRGVEVVIAIDCSRSMLSQDIRPNRLARAKQQLRGLVQRLRGDNIAVVAYAGMPIIQCPMTSDYDMALTLLDSIDVDSVPVQGTAISETIKKSFEVFQTAGKGYKVLVLLTDGEDHEGDATAAAEEAAKRGIRIYALGIGTQKGAPIPLPEGGYKEASGTKVNSRLNFDLLSKLAAITGGKAILSNPSGTLELTEIEKDVSALKEANLSSHSFVQYAERFQYFLVPSFALLLLEMLLTDRRRRIKMEGAGRFD